MTDLPTLVVVPHTHWDREWYEPYDVFRLRLVHMVDRLLHLLDAEPGYRFTLDGQAAAVDDYLEMRPASRDRLAAAVERGQLAIGPFLILLDEFLCDGETIVRNLELGIRSSRRIGREMRIGYLPDMFGHAAQMPQILRGFGIEDAVMWRGVPKRITAHGFEWVAPDGSAVRAENLFDGYGNALDLFAIPGQLGALAPEYLEAVRARFGAEPVLGLLGTDHSAPPSDLMQVLSRHRADGGVPIEVDTIEGYLRRVHPDGAPLDGLPRVDGELRSHAQGNLLPGVFSIRTNLKRAMAEAERRVGVAERLDAAFGVDDHAAFLDEAWYRIVESSAHDSVTGCGADATANEVEARLETAASIARGVLQRTMGHLAAATTTDRYVVANPTGYPRRAQVEIRLADPDATPLGGGVQLLEALPEVLGDEFMATADLPRLLLRIHGRELFGQLINGWTFTTDSLRFDVAEAPVGEFDLARFTAELEERIASDPSGRKQWRVRIIAAPRRGALLGVTLPGLGLADVSPADVPPPVEPVVVEDGALSNGRVSAAVNADGTLRIVADGVVLDGVLRIVDEGDRGDAYNYGPVDPDSAVTEPATVAVDVIERGPLRGRIRIVREYDLPVGLAADRHHRAAETARVPVDAIVELREGEPMVRVTIEVRNPVPDHRLRVVVPAGVPVETSAAAGQFAVTERGREAEGGYGEFPLPTYPAARFVHAGNAAVLLRKHSEFEVVPHTEREDAIALTLLRAVGLMSVNVHPLRDEPAGAEFPVPGAQYLGVAVRTEFAILPAARGWADAQADRWSELFRMEPEVIRGTAGGPPVVGGVAGAGGTVEAIELPAEPGIEAEGAVLESYRRVRAASGDVTVEARFVNYRPVPSALRARASGTWHRTDLAGEVLEEDVELATYEIPPARIVTFRRAE